MFHTISLGPIKTSKTELVDIAKALLAISFAFTLIFSGASLLTGSLSKIGSASFWLLFIVSFITGGLGFLLHELGHKFVAQHFGCTAEFRAYDQLLYVAVGLAALVGFLFAAPGAVMISGMITRRENGLISAAGPCVNFVLGIIFLGLSFLFPAFNFIWKTGFSINVWLGLFNMIPFGNFDGIKIFHWNPYVWTGMVAFGVYFVFFF